MVSSPLVQHSVGGMDDGLMGRAMSFSVLLEYLLLGTEGQRQQPCASTQGLEAQHPQCM